MTTAKAQTNDSLALKEEKLSDPAAGSTTQTGELQRNRLAAAVPTHFL